MTVLKSGGSAVDAVEAAIKSLEDNQITNAGYGSNLCASGTVECDASIVDQVGRSGAVGAVSNVQNPVSVARSVLEASVRPLALGRVPPNFLVGKGAAEWAFDQGLMLLPEDSLVAKTARERWARWKRELDAVEGRKWSNGNGGGGGDYEDEGNAIARADSTCTTAIANGSRASAFADPRSSLPSRSRRNTEDLQFLTDGHMTRSARGDLDLSDSEDISIQDISATSTPSRRRLTVENLDAFDAETGQGAVDTSMTWPQTLDGSDPPLQQSLDHEDDITDTVGAIAIDTNGDIAAGSSSGGIAMKHIGRVGPAALAGIGTCVIPSDSEDEDDTSVATVTSGTGEHMATTMIARVCAERIYMGVKRISQKERKAREEAKAKKALKKQAKQSRARRISKSCKWKKGRRPSHSPSSSSSSSSSSSEDDESSEPHTFGPWTLQPASEDEALQSAIRQDFMAHPGVRNSHCQAAIGIMAVKLMKDGISFCFGHNTDSFALASMVDSDRAPMCLMSRKKRGDAAEKIAQGGRVTRGAAKAAR